jgi:hypothetical protein
LLTVYLNRIFRNSTNLEEAAGRVNKKRKMELSFKDVEELMGMNRDIYKKVGGAVRRK